MCSLVEVNRAGGFGAGDGGDHLLDLLLARLETQRAQHHLERIRVDDALPLGVEQVKGLPDLGTLLLGELQARRLRQGFSLY